MKWKRTKVRFRMVQEIDFIIPGRLYIGITLSLPTRHGVRTPFVCADVEQYFCILIIEIRQPNRFLYFRN